MPNRILLLPSQFQPLFNHIIEMKTFISSPKCILSGLNFLVNSSQVWCVSEHSGSCCYYCSMSKLSLETGTFTAAATLIYYFVTIFLQWYYCNV